MDPRPNQHRLRRRRFRIVRRGACATSHSLHRVSSSSQTRFRWALLGVYAIRYFLPINNYSILLSQRHWRSDLGDPYRIRTDVKGVRGLCLNHLTNGPFGTPSGTRTLDTLIKSQVLYQLS